MRRTNLILSAVLVIGLPGMAQAAGAHDPQHELAKITAGRTAGSPVSCIMQNQINSSRIIDRTAIVYTMNDGTVYVNTPPSGASSLDSNATLVTDTHSSQLCNVDIVRLWDSSSKMQTGSVGLGNFVPYARPSHASVK